MNSKKSSALSLNLTKNRAAVTFGLKFHHEVELYLLDGE